MPRVISREGGGPVPYAYTLGPSEQLTPQTITAEYFPDTKANAFIPCVSFYAQDGTLLGRFPMAQQISGENGAWATWGAGAQAVADPDRNANWSDELAGGSNVAVGAGYVVAFGAGHSFVETREWLAVAFNCWAQVGDVDCEVQWNPSTSAFGTQTRSATFTQVVGNAKTRVLAAHGGVLNSVKFSETVPASGALLTFGILGTNQAVGTYGV